MPTSRPSLLDLHHAAGDQSLGQTLLRLARLAAATDNQPHPDREQSDRSNRHRDHHHVPRTHGRVRGQEFLAANPGGSVRKESNR